MPSFLKLIGQCHDQHNNINQDPTEYVEAVETSNRKEEVGEVARRSCSICIDERVSSPPSTFME